MLNWQKQRALDIFPSAWYSYRAKCRVLLVRLQCDLLPLLASSGYEPSAALLSHGSNLWGTVSQHMRPPAAIASRLQSLPLLQP